jgi:hypothetical protein
MHPDGTFSSFGRPVAITHQMICDSALYNGFVCGRYDHENMIDAGWRQ